MTLDWYSLADYFQHFERTKSTINLGTFVGAGGIRDYVMGENNRPATTSELDQMRQLVAQAMQQGAFGVSTALEYIPGIFASTDELASPYIGSLVANLRLGPTRNLSLRSGSNRSVQPFTARNRKVATETVRRQWNCQHTSK